jgi:two-component system sensor histidine kinase RegB
MRDTENHSTFVILPESGVKELQHSAGHKNMLQLIHLRWLAVFGQISTIALVTLGFGIHLPILPMLYVLAGLIAFNIGSHLRWHEEVRVSNRELLLALLVDVATLTAQLYLSGGTGNPFAFLFLLQVILSAVLLEAWSTWLIVALSTACLMGLSRFSLPLKLPPDSVNSLFSLYRDGMLICFLLNAALLVFFLTRINSNLKERDAQLADLQKRAAEEEHIVKMGLLASGAAHELGTPLATLSVILGDWRRMPQFTQDAELTEELTEMQRQLQRCKSIVSSILLSAGEARGESSVKTTINTFLNDLAEDFRATRILQDFEYRNSNPHDIPVVFDVALKQMICNVLDNALEASPHWLALDVQRQEEVLTLLVTDRGPGFQPHILDKLGQPYQSTKGRAGSGLGLFFVVNVVRKLGGTVSARNRPEGGAAVEVTLPISALKL